MTIKNLLEIVKANKLFLLLIIGLNFFVYINVLFNGFVSADDLAGYVNNSSLQDFWAKAQTLRIGAILFSLFKNTVGNNPFVPHLHSLLLHILITILVFLFTYKVFSKKVSAISTLLFAVHPVNAEPVSWMSAAGYLYNTMFILTALILYVLYRENKKSLYLAFSVFIYIIGIVTTASVWLFSLPLILLVLEYYIWDKKISLQNSLYSIPYFAAVGLSYLVYFAQLGQERVHELATTYNFSSGETTPWLNRLPYTIYMIFKLLIFPDKLSIFHEGQIIQQGHYLFMILLTLSIIPLFLFLKKKYRIIAGLFALILIPMYPTFSPIQVAFFIAERYLYVSSIFFTILVAILITGFQEKYLSKSKFALIVTLLLLSVYSARTFIRTMDWKNSRTLWEATAKTASLSPRVYNNLGDAYSTEGNKNASIDAFKKAIELNSNYVEAIHNLGTVYVETGQYDLAEELFAQALSLNPQYEGAERAKQILELLNKRNLNEGGQE